MYDTLFMLDLNLCPQYSLCEDYTVSSDNTVYTLTLRDDAHFHDGSALTAVDVVYSIDQAKKDGSIYSSRLAYILSAKASGDHTVVITLNSPLGYFTSLLDFPIVKNKSVNNKNPEGTGAYFIYSDDEDTYLSYNSYWWKSTPSAYRIELIPCNSADSLLSEFESGFISLTTSDFTGTYAINYSTNHEVYSYPTTTMQYIGYNISNPLLSKAEVRRMISSIIDREYISKSILSGYAKSANIPISPASPAYSSISENEDIDELLEAAGIKDYDSDGKLEYYVSSRKYEDVTFTLLVNNENSRKVEIANYIKTRLEDLGIAVTVKSVNFSAYQTALSSLSFDMYIAETALYANFDFSKLIKTDGALNFGKYTNPEFDSKLNEFLSYNSELLYNHYADDFYKLFVKEQPITVICFKDHSTLVRRGVVKNYSGTYHNAFFDFANWTIADYN